MAQPQTDNGGNVTDIRTRQTLSEPLQTMSESLQTGDGGGTFGSMNDRLGRLEGQVNGLQHTQSMLLGASAIVSTLLLAAFVGFAVYFSQRVDTLAQKIDNIPGEIRNDMREIVQTLSGAITATKQAPQIVIIPAQPQAQQIPQ